MYKLEIDHAIGDVVFTASARDIDREIVKAIKIVGMQNRISYGIKYSGGGGLLGSLYSSSDGYKWYSSSDIFTSLEDAQKRQEKLKKQEAERDSAASQKEILDMESKLKFDQENLRRKKQGLPLLEEGDYDD